LIRTITDTGRRLGEVLALERQQLVDGVFHFAGGPDIATAAQPTDAPTARVRSTLMVAEDRRSMTALWERSEDGSNWHSWMDISFTRSD
jgi:hypothetical protein